MKRCACLFFLLFALHAGAQQSFNKLRMKGKLITKNNYYEIPFDDADKPIHTAAVLKGEPYDFDLDTGGPLYISSALQRKHKFRVIGRTRASDPAGNTIEVEMVRIDTIKVGPFVFAGVPAFVIDLENSSIRCAHISGNIGSNLLRHLVVQFDLQEKRIALTDNKALLKKQLPERPLARVDEQSNVFFAIKTDGDVVDTVQFDTGDGELYHMAERTARRYRLLHPGGVIRKGFGVLSLGIAGPGAPFTQYVMKPESIKVGDEVIGGGLVYIPGAGTSRMGMKLLNYGVLQINYPAATYGFQRFDTPYVAARYDYGFEPIRDGKKVLVGCTWEKSAAVNSGMKQGDRLLKINETDLASLPMCDIDAAMKKEFRQGVDSLFVTYKDGKGRVSTVSLPKRVLIP